MTKLNPPVSCPSCGLHISQCRCKGECKGEDIFRLVGFEEIKGSAKSKALSKYLKKLKFTVKSGDDYDKKVLKDFDWVNAENWETSQEHKVFLDILCKAWPYRERSELEAGLAYIRDKIVHSNDDKIKLEGCILLDDKMVPSRPYSLGK